MASRYRTRKHRRARRLGKGKPGGFRVWAGRLAKGALSLATLASLVYLGFIGYRYFQISGKLNLGEVKIVGCVNVMESELLDLARVDFRSNLLNLDLQELSRRLTQHPWVEKAKVRRDVSGRALVIEVQERIPRAIILLDALYLVDRQGQVFKRVEPNEKLDFPILTGVHVQDWKGRDPRTGELIREALELLEAFEGRKIFSLKEVSEIHLSKKNGLTLFTLEGGIPIRFGFGDYGDQLNRLEKVLPDLRRKFKQIESIALNYPRKVVVKMKDSQGRETQKVVKEGSRNQATAAGKRRFDYHQKGNPHG